MRCRANIDRASRLLAHSQSLKYPYFMDSLQQPKAVSSTDTPNDAGDLTTTLALNLRSTPEKTQLQIIQDLIATGEPGWSVLMDFLLERRSADSNPATAMPDAGKPAADRVDLVAGKVYQVLFSSGSVAATEFLKSHFPQGIVSLKSDAGIDYAPLQQLLAEQKFQTADQMTLQKLCELAGPAAVQRKWVYFTEVKQFAIADLHTINNLWLVHSEGKFGFSAQREIWLSVGKNWEKLWSKIGWKAGNNWTRYPQEFTWDLTAPRGHLPLSNQLRGVQAITALLTHPAWGESSGEGRG